MQSIYPKSSHWHLAVGDVKVERKMRKMGSAVEEKITHLIEHTTKKIISSSRLFISKFHLVQGTRQIEKPNSIGNISMIISICGGIYSL